MAVSRAILVELGEGMDLVRYEKEFEQIQRTGVGPFKLLSHSGNIIYAFTFNSIEAMEEAWKILKG